MSDRVFKKLKNGVETEVSFLDIKEGDILNIYDDGEFTGSIIAESEPYVDSELVVDVSSFKSALRDDDSE